jgi:uncharacterized membrane protein
MSMILGLAYRHLHMILLFAYEMMLPYIGTVFQDINKLPSIIVCLVYRINSTADI